MRLLYPVAVALCCLVLDTQQLPQTLIHAIKEEQPREAYFNGTASLRLASTVSVHRHSGLSFRTCDGGRLFLQRYNDDEISLDVTPDGLIFTAIIEKQKYQAKLSARLLNNVWHNVNLFFRLGNLTLSTAGHTQIVANATYNSAILMLSDYNVNASLIVGEGFKGCILQGPGILFNNTVNYGAVLGTCPSDPKGCGPNSVAGSLTAARPEMDYCHNEPCMMHGKCISRQDRYECQCYPGYSGKNCQLDNGSPCKINPCKNSATCREDENGDFTCSCPPGWTGHLCDLQLGGRFCKENPCKNKGTCSVVSDTEYKCDCPPGWTGKTCEIDVNECASNPCENGGICTDGVANYTCRCDSTGYEGKNCEVNIDECLNNNPCLNKGKCFDNYGGYICHCPDGFEGLNCELNLNECLSSPCRNGGTCVDDVGTYHCSCPPGYAGHHCEASRRSLCENAECPVNSICLDIKGEAQCVCKPGFMGNPPNCSINYCASNPCVNGGTCTSDDEGYNCTCTPEWKGKNCQVNVDECLSQPCLNGGICIDGNNGYTCNCTQDYMGDHCEREYDACAVNPCDNNGTCTLLPRLKREFVCECPPGFEGKMCEINIDDCIGVICPGDNKVCVDGIGGSECKCKDGYREPNCTLIIDHCVSKPCKNGSCIDLGDEGYRCECMPGFTGIDCGSDVNECEVLGNASCNNGICVNTRGSYNCYCRPGFSGDHCDVDINECLCGPCKNNATCVDKINAFECICPPGYGGKTCHVDVNECESNPCKNNAQCIDQIAAYSCICTPGFTGHNCETNIDDCYSQPCLNHGKCIDGINNYTCDCMDTGFQGNHCEINIDECLSNPCVNEGVCVDDIKTYKCRCYPGYTGHNCEIDINECESSPCQYNGTCLERSNKELYKSNAKTLPAIFTQEFSYANASGYECLCVQGLIGKNCEKNINECESNPCLAGTCKDRIGGYTCECDEGFEGDHCQHDIDECMKYQPCVHGNCIDGRADYFCNCQPEYGGKNCSVKLIGCRENACQNGGTCWPYLLNDTEHRFNCTCPNGFYGDTCHHVTTMSLSGSSYVMVNTTREEGYDIQFRFRTTLPSGLLAMGKGTTFYILELVNGKLNLHSSILNKWEGVFIGSGLNDAKWQRIFVAINATHLVLSANDEQTIYPINLNESPSVSPTTFPTTYVGGTIRYLQKLTHGPHLFVGCVEDVVINGEWIYSGMESDSVLMDHIESSCPREEQCLPNPCKAGGHCTDRWRDFFCQCQRPYLGHTCQYNMTAATFGYENITNGYVTVKVSDTARRAVRTILDISMFIKTRQQRGDIFYLGSEPSSPSSLPQDNTYIAAQLEAGQLVVRMQFNETEAYTVGGVKLNDGNNHLIQVIRNMTLVQVKINGSEYFRKTIGTTGPLNITVLYLGGLPQTSRYIRQVDTRQTSTMSDIQSAIPQVNFKGIIQDVQISNGVEIMVVEFYPLKAKDIPKPIQFGNVSFDHDKVLAGIISDNVCESNPCFHNGTCQVTWNDFLCQCPRGYTGKTCQEMEFCQLQDCPTGSKCQNLDDGYECIANATFNGNNTLFTYIYENHTPMKNSSDTSKVTIETIEITYRSNSGGTMMHISPFYYDDNNKHSRNTDQHFTVSVYKDSITVAWKLTVHNQDSLTFSKENPDGNWTSIIIRLHSNSIICGFKNSIEETPTQTSSRFSFSEWYELLSSGTVTLGGVSDNYWNINSYIMDNNSVSLDVMERQVALTTSSPMQEMIFNEPFKGCLGEVRIGSMLLHYFAFDQVYGSANFTPGEYLSLQVDENNSMTGIEDNNSKENIGCRLCFEYDCQNDGHCLDEYNSYVCQCPAGYAQDNCSEDIDECLLNDCENNSTCVDGIANYTCICNKGWQGSRCDKDINECVINSPCQHGGVCVNLPGSFRCECPDQFTGDSCQDFRLITCENHPCKNGSSCSDIVNKKTGDNFTCTCMPGYEGTLCEDPYCVVKKCQNGGRCDFLYQAPQCTCPLGFTGHYCETNIDDCATDSEGNVPCQNYGMCIDGINSFTCNCSGTGYTGVDCTIDVDECASKSTDCGYGKCVNRLGRYECACKAGYCGSDCKTVDPCNDDICKNGGTCLCDENTGYFCQCADGYIGQNCTESEHLLGSSAFDIAVIVGPIVGILLLVAIGSLTAFFMMARKKRATRGTYSPSAQEFSNPRVEMDNVMKPPPEERLI
ncbi:protein crumbs isoform X2 [Diachasmimorpha longicaudata]|uniref:protein crumbs isoform X2 n=1 Tax=Diachasmimorpha longicaudata TaxID=58733 RepID=UPI0030B8DC8F